MVLRAETQELINTLIEQVKEQGVVDVSKGVAEHLGVTDSRLRTAVLRLEDQGYQRFYLKWSKDGQSTTGKFLASSDKTFKEVYEVVHGWSKLPTPELIK